jgi:hypothetical protein
MTALQAVVAARLMETNAAGQREIIQNTESGVRRRTRRMPVTFWKSEEMKLFPFFRA